MLLEMSLVSRRFSPSHSPLVVCGNVNDCNTRSYHLRERRKEKEVERQWGREGGGGRGREGGRGRDISW